MVDEEKVIQFLLTVATGMADAHLKGVMHRDLKPGNILYDNDGNAKIADWGQALSISSNAPHRGMCGTPRGASSPLELWLAV